MKIILKTFFISLILSFFWFNVASADTYKCPTTGTVYATASACSASCVETKACSVYSCTGSSLVLPNCILDAFSAIPKCTYLNNVGSLPACGSTPPNLKGFYNYNKGSGLKGIYYAPLCPLDASISCTGNVTSPGTCTKSTACTTIVSNPLVNGACGPGLTANSGPSVDCNNVKDFRITGTINACSAGNISNLQDLSTQKRWTCNGTYGGSTASCVCAQACVPSTWSPATSSVCSGTSFTQTSNCGTTQTAIGTKVGTFTPATSTVCAGTSFTQTDGCTTKTAVGTKSCACVPSTWSPATSSVCSGTSFTQTSNCGTTQTAIGTKVGTFTPATSTVCAGTSFTQTDGCTTKTAIGTQPCVTNYALTVTAGQDATITSSPAGINCNSSGLPTCTSSLSSGTIITLNASVLPGSHFVSWNGSCSGTNPACTITMDSAKTVSMTTANDCGDGNPQAGEQCDDGSNNGACPKTCSSSCTTNSCSSGQVKATKWQEVAPE